MLPFTRETPDRVWLGFVNEADEQPASLLLHRVVPILAVAGLALLVLSGGKQKHEEQGPPPSSAAAARARMAAAGASTEADDQDAPVVSDEAVAADEPPAEVEAPLVAPEPPAEVEPEPEPRAPPEPPLKREPKPPTPLSPAAAKKAAHAASGLRGALSEGRASASRENFAVVTLDGEDVGWEDAKTACSSLVVDGIGGWHLPSRGEAREIDRGHAAPRGAYWTRQRGKHDDTIYVHDTRTHRSSPWLEQEIAAAVCVQPKPR